jgi:hypothetical protein
MPIRIEIANPNTHKKNNWLATGKYFVTPDFSLQQTNRL